MANVLVLTTDLPFFPGKNGHDFFNLRFLAASHYVAIVAPRYPTYPEAGVRNLRDAVQGCHLWPEPASPTQLFTSHQAKVRLPAIVNLLPRTWREHLLARALNVEGQPFADVYERLAILNNCAPHVLAALDQRTWQAFVLIQSSMAPWLEFLPKVGARIVYFHDVRHEYLARAASPPSAKEIRRIHFQEQRACDVEAVGFVSNLDLTRAINSLTLPRIQVVAPIPVDTTYFVRRPVDWKRDSRKIILFTGHLRHPPNVDAVLYFLSEIWPRIRKSDPDVIFQAVGLTPDPKLEHAIAAAGNAELHANVPDIRPYFWNATAYIVPMRYGGGVRQKIFEAWAMGVPVVSTTMGAEGTGAEDGVNCCLADSPADLATRLQMLIAGASTTAITTKAAASVEAHAIPRAAGAFAELVTKGIAACAAKPFKLLYDLRWMEIGHAGGIEQMTHELLHAISGLDSVNEYRLHLPASTYHDLNLAPGFRNRPYFSDRDAVRRESFRSAFTNQIADSLQLPIVLTPEMRTLRQWKQMDFGLVHSLVGFIHPDLKAFPHIVTMHDLQHLAYPEFFAPDEWKVREELYRDSAGRAAHIIAISEFTRRDIHSRYGVPLEKITTIWNIPSRYVWTPIDQARSQELLRAMGVAGPFLFFPAHCWPHKNHTRLIEAFNLIVPHIDPTISLVLTGRPFPSDHPARAVIDRCGLQTRVRHLGYRSPLEMKALFHQCLVLVFPSLFEGFGMPVAEAIIAGKPVACSNTTSLPEIAGDAALTFDPENIHEMGGRLLEIINDPGCRERLSAAAKRRRPLFSARLTAIKTISLYRRVHEALNQV